jgi:hypothetical protein
MAVAAAGFGVKETSENLIYRPMNKALEEYLDNVRNK